MRDKHYYARRLKERLPRVLQSGHNLSTLFEVLGQQMIHMEDGARLLMRSCWYGLARGWKDPGQDPSRKRETELGKIGTLFGCLPGIDESTAQFRRRLVDFVHIHWEVGLGTAPSILKLVALVYRAEKVPDKIEWKEEMAVARFDVRDKQGKSHRLKLELMDNPPRQYGVPQEVRVCEPDSDFVVVNRGLDPAIPKIELTANYGAVAVPMLVHEETGTQILYTGLIPKGVLITLEHGKSPLLNGLERKKFLHNCYPHFNKAEFDSVRYADSDLEEADAVFIGHGFRYNSARFWSQEIPVPARFASFGIKPEFPYLARGENHWRYRTLGPNTLNTYLENLKNLSDENIAKLLKTNLINLEDLSVENIKKLLVHAQDSVAPRIDLKFIWESRAPACFVLRIPGDYVPPFMHNFDELKQAVNRALEYGRAAGVEFELAIQKPSS